METKTLGLTSSEVQDRSKEYGKNKIEERKPSIILKIFKPTPIKIMFLIAAVLSYISGKLFDFYFILVLLMVNSGLSFWQERKADNAIKKLNEKLQINVKVFRDNSWIWVNSIDLVPGDFIELAMGDIVPADVEVVESENFTISDATLTGESLPKEKKNNDKIYSGSFVVTGLCKATVEFIGSKTYFGKTLQSVEKIEKKSVLEKDILDIAKFLSIVSLLGIVIVAVVFFLRGSPITDILELGLSLAIAGIPIALPTVMTLIISLGVLKLSSENVIVRRLSSLEDLATFDILFTDKTGTLTTNQIGIEKVIPYSSKEQEVLFYAFLSSVKDSRSIISQCIIKKYTETKQENSYEILDFNSADSKTKRSFAIAKLGNDKISVTVGAPQVILSFCNTDDQTKKRFEKDLEIYAQTGFRTLAVAFSKTADNTNMTLAGLLLLSDPVRADARNVIDFLKDNGVRVKMVTGDHVAIAQRVGHDLGLSEEDIYAEVLPDDKLKLATTAKREHVVAMTGDGINDLPAIKAANIGIAVSNALDAVKSSADIVLLSSGISVIRDAILESRKIFARLYSYSVYRISESFRLIGTIVILGLMTGSYPLLPIQLILLSILNDLPIVSLAYNHVKIGTNPAKINAKARLILSCLFGVVGIINSVLFFFILKDILHLNIALIQTAFFLKLTVSGHMLIYVAHTSEKWYKYLPSMQVLLATTITQLVATCFALFGFLMVQIPLSIVLLVWLWALVWMQVSELMKPLQKFFVH
ncbi:Copper-exporting P-type ATPase B [uncultured archaeon]|nr:Copper-exporting P-type ATPase B [uncultured archaeon]